LLAEGVSIIPIVYLYAIKLSFAKACISYKQSAKEGAALTLFVFLLGHVGLI
jgi:hypothetical protein